MLGLGCIIEKTSREIEKNRSESSGKIDEIANKISGKRG
jgi:hypothetical protein